METEYTPAYDMNALILASRDFKKSLAEVLEFAEQSGATKMIGRVCWILIELDSGRKTFCQVGTFAVLWERQLVGEGSFSGLFRQTLNILDSYYSRRTILYLSRWYADFISETRSHRRP